MGASRDRKRGDMSTWTTRGIVQGEYIITPQGAAKVYE